LALTKGDGVAAAEGAGADHVGGDELIAKIAEGWLDFDAVVATPDMMAAIGSKLGRILGPRGLLPHPKSGTVGTNIADLVKSLKAGQIEFRNDKTGVVHAPIGKASFDAKKLEENLVAFQTALEAAKPGAAKGVFVRSLYLTTTMGPSVKVLTSSK
jgi:large subunit ribosomal protein L1